MLTSGKQNKLIQYVNDDIINNKSHHLIEAYTNTIQYDLRFVNKTNNFKLYIFL